jgi:hypothetical protein
MAQAIPHNKSVVGNFMFFYSKLAVIGETGQKKRQRRLPLTRELSAKQTEGEKEKQSYFRIRQEPKQKNRDVGGTSLFFVLGVGF